MPELGKHTGTEKIRLFCDGKVEAFRYRHNDQIPEVLVDGFSERAYGFEVPSALHVDRRNISLVLLSIQGAVFLFEVFDGLEKINSCPGGGTLETLFNVTHSFAVPGIPYCEQAVQEAEACRTVQ